MRWNPAALATCAVLGCAAGASAQPAGTLAPMAPATGFQTCVVAGVAAGSDGDAAGSSGFADRPNDMLMEVWDCAADFAQDRLVGIGLAILGGLVVIMTIWTGVGFMLSGEFDFSRLLGHVFLAGLGFMILNNYAGGSWILGNVGLLRLFADEAVQVSELVIGRTDELFATAYTDARQRADDDIISARALAEAGDYTELAARLDQPFGREYNLLALFDFERRTRVWLMAQVRSVSVWVLWLVGWIVYAQYAWGFFTLMVLTLLGPLFVPWLMVPQLDFLFWGWIKAFLHGVFYMIGAAAVYAMVGAMLLAPLRRFADVTGVPADPGSMTGLLGLSWSLLVEWLPLVVLALLASLKVGAVSSAIIGTGSMPSAGLSSALGKAQAATATIAGFGPRVGAAVGGPPGKPGGDPLSVETELTSRQRAQRALREAHRRSGPGRGGKK